MASVWWQWRDYYRLVGLGHGALPDDVEALSSTLTLYMKSRVQRALVAVCRGKPLSPAPQLTHIVPHAVSLVVCKRNAAKMAQIIKSLDLLRTQKLGSIGCRPANRGGPSRLQRAGSAGSPHQAQGVGSYRRCVGKPCRAMRHPMGFKKMPCSHRCLPAQPSTACGCVAECHPMITKPCTSPLLVVTLRNCRAFAAESR